jgi:hypothetical protein
MLTTAPLYRVTVDGEGDEVAISGAVLIDTWGYANVASSKAIALLIEGNIAAGVMESASCACSTATPFAPTA